MSRVMLYIGLLPYLNLFFKGQNRPKRSKLKVGIIHLLETMVFPWRCDILYNVTNAYSA